MLASWGPTELVWRNQCPRHVTKHHCGDVTRRETLALRSTVIMPSVCDLFFFLVGGLMIRVPVIFDVTYFKPVNYKQI